MEKLPISTVENCDCMTGMKYFPDKFFDLAICDPPYGLEDWNRRGINKLLNKGFDSVKIDVWNVKPDLNYFTELFRVSKAQIIWGANHFFDFLGSTKAMIVWDKRMDGMHFNQCEIAWVNNLNESIKIYRQSNKNRSNTRPKIHPTQKPIELYKWCLENYAKEGDKILDTHLGSGSSRIAAYDMGFDFWGWEIDRDYFEAQEKRFALFKSQGKLQFV